MKIDFALDYQQDIEKYLRRKYPEMLNFKILRKSLDARGANRGKIPKFNYRVEIINEIEAKASNNKEIKNIKARKSIPIIVGAGPAGLFCALKLLDSGIKPILIERGDRVTNRVRKIAKFWKSGILDIDSNVCFGEGGAGLFSDGKLITRIKSPHVGYVLDQLIRFGAEEEIKYLAGPHIGSNKLRAIIVKIVDYLKDSGVEIKFNCKVDDLLIEKNEIFGVKLTDGTEFRSKNVVLATGHSARDVFELLQKYRVELSSKDFAIGVRIEHPRKLIDKMQFGYFSGDSLLGAARYKLTYNNKKTGRGVYSFCMCPGGYVLSCGSEADGMVVNGMSNFLHNSLWSNSAIVVTIKETDLKKYNGELKGVDFQREIERNAFNMSKKYSDGVKLPAESLKSFLYDDDKSLTTSSAISGVFNCKMDKILPKFIIEELRKGIISFDKKMSGIISDKALLIAPETRTSSPVRVDRDRESLQSLNCRGLYPTGEGAGYAGGITSAAVDGVNVAMRIVDDKD